MSHATQLTWLGHSTVRMDLPDGAVVFIDPFLQSNPACPSTHRVPERLDAILLTHAHSDHLGDALDLALRHSATVVANFEVAEWFRRRGVEKVVGVNLGGTVEVAGPQGLTGLRASMVRADHTSSFPADENGVRSYAGVSAGWMIRLPGVGKEGETIYHAGDTALFGEMRDFAMLYAPTLAFLPIGDRFTMGPEHAAIACEWLGVRRVVPIHWGTFPQLTGTPAELRAALDRRECRCEVVTPRAGERFR